MREIMLCRYSYDPLDRLVGTLPLSDAESQRFYCKNLLATEIQGASTFSIFQHEERHLAQQQRDGNAVKTSLLATDQQRSVLIAINPAQHRTISYSPYGHRSISNGLLSLLGFNGERQDPVTGHYFLGIGYRIFNTVLMRFNSPDSWSPFGDGGINPYAYCLGDSINRNDPTGHISPAIPFLTFRRSGRFVQRLGSSSNQLQPAIQNPILPTWTRSASQLDPIPMQPFTYRPASGGLNNQHRSRLGGSLDSIASSSSSTSSSESTTSHLSAASFGSNSSINSFGSNHSVGSYGSDSSYATTSSGSRRSSTSSDSDWSGSGRRINVGLISDQAFRAVPTPPSESPRVQFEDNALILESDGNISSRFGSSAQVSRIRRDSSH
ncbi:hypothetical protein D3C76_505810 [compost metagenome]